jgi:hypothetical protein
MDVDRPTLVIRRDAEEVQHAIVPVNLHELWERPPDELVRVCRTRKGQEICTCGKYALRWE